MSYNNFNSVEELDALLDQELEEAEEESTEEPTVEEPVEEEKEEGELQPEPTDNQDEKGEEPMPEEGLQRRYTPQEKQNYAFNRMRIENKNLKTSVDETNKFLERLARVSGYSSIDELKQNVTKTLDAKEAEKQGVSPEVYARLNAQEEAIAQLRQQEAQVTFNNKVLAFQRSLNEITQEYGFSQDDVKDMLGTLEDEGYTLETLVSVPNPKFIIKGAFGDKIFQAQKQRVLEQEKKQTSLDRSKISPSVDTNAYDEDEEIKRELELYAREHNYYFE